LPGNELRPAAEVGAAQSGAPGEPDDLAELVALWDRLSAGGRQALLATAQALASQVESTPTDDR
jgi:hypothetical protein